MYTIAFWPLFFAALSGFVIGFAWYNSTFGFGKMWMRLSAITPEAVEGGKKYMIISMVIGFLALLWSSWVLSYVLEAFYVFDWIGAMEIAFWCWAGFIAPVMLGMVLWERKPFKLYVLNVTHWLVVLMVMSVVIVVGSTI